MYTKHGLDETRLGLWHGLTLFHPPIETLFKACRGSLRVGRYYKWIPTSCVQQPINRSMFGLLWGRKSPRGCPAAMTRPSSWTCPAGSAGAAVGMMLRKWR
jgi:hypothetical protein